MKNNSKKLVQDAITKTIDNGFKFKGDQYSLSDVFAIIDVAKDIFENKAVSPTVFSNVAKFFGNFSGIEVQKSTIGWTVQAVNQ